VREIINWNEIAGSVIGLTPREAVQRQKTLVPLVREEPLQQEPGLVAGVDVSIKDGRAIAAVVVVRLSDMATVAESHWNGPAVFPYVPGLLSFREIPAIVPALERLETWPDVFMLDGHGRAHPRRFGLACHLGVLLGMPAFGVGKSLLVGRFEDPGLQRGDTAAITHGDDIIGWAVRTRTGVSPVFVSSGHLMSQEDCIRLTLRAGTKYRLPEPTRRAHALSRTIVH
jgi:deoxyribonuclease V